MIILDTYTWVWWVHGDKQPTETQHATMLANEGDVIGVSAISCWEVAKFEQALNYPGFKYLRSLQRLHLNLRNRLAKRCFAHTHPHASTRTVLAFFFWRRAFTKACD